MRRFVIALLVFGAPHVALADTGLRDWSGLSVGISAGVARSYADSEGFARNGATGAYWAAVDVPVVSEAVDTDLETDTAIAGIDVGYSRQHGRFVYGVNLGAYYFDVESVTSEFRPYPTNAAGFIVKSKVGTDWLLTLAPKADIALGDFLFEINAGAALTDLTTSFDLVYEVNGRTASASRRETKLG